MKTFTVEVTQVVTVTQADRDLAGWFTRRMAGGGLYDEQAAKLLAQHRESALTDLTAASQLEHSGLISREKYNHIVENIRARESIRGAMA